MLPDSLKAELAEHLRAVRSLHWSDLHAGHGRVHLPFALAEKYSAAAAESVSGAELLGHRSVKTTMIYTHVHNRGGLGVQSPVDKL